MNRSMNELQKSLGKGIIGQEPISSLKWKAVYLPTKLIMCKIWNLSKKDKFHSSLHVKCIDSTFQT